MVFGQRVPSSILGFTLRTSNAVTPLRDYESHAGACFGVSGEGNLLNF